MGVGPAELELLERVIKRRRVLERGECIFRRGDRFHAVYAVKSGSIKTSLPLDSEGVQITGYHLSGEFLGLDAVGSGAYQYDACALETSSLCELPFDKLEHLSMLVHSMQRQILRIMSGQIHHDLLMHVLQRKKTAEGRLAGFLVSLSVRFESRGFSGSEFKLSMSRDDIGNYLGLAKETVCRLCHTFRDRQIVSIDHRHVRIHDRHRLEGIAGLKAHDCQPLRPGVCRDPGIYPAGR